MNSSAAPSAADGVPSADARITEQAAGRLNDRHYGVLKSVSCACRAGVLTLRGRVPTFYLKQIAQEAVADIPGVCRIDNRIEVAAPPAWASPPGTEGQRTAPILPQ